MGNSQRVDRDREKIWSVKVIKQNKKVYDKELNIRFVVLQVLKLNRNMVKGVIYKIMNIIIDLANFVFFLVYYFGKYQNLYIIKI